MTVQVRLFTDGGARGNPGPAASAFVLEAADGKLATADRGPRALTMAETASDNLRAFGYFFKDAHVSIRTANETAAVVRALAR